MNNSTFNRLPFNSFPAAGGRQVQYSTDAVVVAVRSKTYATDAVLRATQTKTYATDALLQGGGSKFYGTDAILATPYHDNGAWVEAVGNNLSQPVDNQQYPEWSTYSRPSVPHTKLWGKNTQTGKMEYYDTGTGSWKNFDGTAAP